jgi:hypothetical protein
MAGVGAQASARETAELTMKAKAEDKITIYGPKSDGTYIVEFRTAAGEALAISIPRTEATVIRHFSGANALWACRAGYRQSLT